MGFHRTPRRGDRLLGHLRDHPAQGRGAGQRTACRGRGRTAQIRVRARFNGVPGAASGLEATGGELLISYEAWQLWLRTQHPALSAGASIDGNLTHVMPEFPKLVSKLPLALKRATPNPPAP